MFELATVAMVAMVAMDEHGLFGSVYFDELPNLCWFFILILRSFCDFSRTYEWNIHGLYVPLIFI